MPGAGRPFQKGQIANPRGRPKKDGSVSEWMRYRLRQAVSEEDRRAAVEALADAALTHALAGDVAWAKLALERAFGAVPQPLEHSGPNGGPIVLQWTDVEVEDAGD